MQVLGVLEAHAVCYNVLCAADERVLVVQAVQTTHLRHHPCQIGAAVFSWQKTERLLLLWHQPTERVDCIVLHSMTPSNSPDGSHHHITTPITSMDKLHRFPPLEHQNSPSTLRHQPANKLHCLAMDAVVIHTTTPTNSVGRVHRLPHCDTKHFTALKPSPSTLPHLSKIHG